MRDIRSWFALAAVLSLAATVAAAESLRLESAPGGGASLIAARTLAAGDTLRVWVARYDSLGTYMDAPVADWTLGGGVATWDSTHGASVLVGATHTGTGALVARVAELATPAALITVVPGMPAQVIVRATPGAGVALASLDTSADSTIVLYAGARDAFGNWTGAASVDWFVTPGRGTVTPAHAGLTVLVADRAGSGILRASSPGLTSMTLPLVVLPGKPAVLRIENASGAALGDTILPIGATLTVHARALDARGNTATTPSVTWMMAGSAARCAPLAGDTTTLLGELPGVSRLEVRSGTLHATSGLVTVVAGAVARLRLSQTPDAWVPLGATTIDADATLEFFALGEDAAGFLLGPVQAQWSSTDAGVARPEAVAAESRTDVHAGRAGTARIVITRAGAAPDSSDVLRVVAGKLARLGIETASDGRGTAIGARTLSADSSLVLHAVGRDADGNFIAPQSATWTLSNGIGTLSATLGTQTTLVASRLGTGLVTAAAAMHVAAAGPITVTAGAAHHVRITDATATPLGARLLRPGDRLDAYAGWRDADDNLLGTASVQWSWDGDALGQLPGSPVEFCSWIAQPAGRGRLIATPAGGAAAADTSAWITVTAGAIARLAITTRGLPLEPSTLAADSSLELHAEAFDAGDNALGEVPVVWSLESHGGTASLDPRTGSATRLLPSRVGALTLRARHTSGVEARGEVTVVAGRPARVWIETRSDGTGTAIAPQSLTAGMRLGLSAVARDAKGNFAGSIDAGWIVEGGIGAVQPGFGPQTIFEAMHTGSGRVRAVHAWLPGDVTALLAVGPNAAVFLSIERANGAALTGVNLSADDSLAVRAMGRDLFDNPTGVVDAAWSVVEGPEFGSFSNGPFFQPRRAGTLTFKATWNGLNTLSDAVVVTPGRPSGTIALQATPHALRADGQSRARLAVGPVFDRHGNRVDDGTWIELAASDCRFATDTGGTGMHLQVPILNGVAGLDVVALAAPGTARITATSGSARGDLAIPVQSPLALTLAVTDPALVFAGRNWTPSGVVQPVGTPGITVLQARCTVDDGNGGTWSATLGSPAPLAADAPTALAMTPVAIPASAHAGSYAPRWHLEGIDAVGHAWVQEIASPPGALTVTSTRLLAVRTDVPAIQRADTLQVEIECEVAAGTLRLEDVRLVVENPADWVTTWIAPAAGTTLASGAVHVLHAIAVPRSTARLGTAQLDARVTFRAGNETWIAAGAARPALVEVISPAPLLTGLVPSQTTLVTGQMAPAGAWWLDLAIENRGSAAFECAGLDLDMLVDGVDRSSEFVLAPSLIFQRSGTPQLSPGERDTLRVQVKRTGTTLGSLRVRAVVATQDVATGIPLPLVERTSSAIALQLPGNLFLGPVAVDASHLLAGGQRAWSVTCAVENRGGSDLVVEPAGLELRLQGLDRTALFGVAGPEATELPPGAARSLVFTCTGAPVEAGVVAMHLNVAAVETASRRRIELTRDAAGPRVELPARIEVVEVEPRRASRGAPVRFAVRLTNRGQATAALDTTSVLLVDSLSAALTVPAAIAAGETLLTALRQVVPTNHQPLGQRALVFGARGHQHGEAFAVDLAADSLLVEAPPALTILGIGTSQPSVTRDQTQPWDLNVVVRNDGQADYRIESAGVQVYVDGVDRSPTYEIALRKPFGTPLVPASLDTLRFRVTRTGSHIGPATLEASVTARDANSGRMVEANTFAGGKGSVRVQAPGVLRADSLLLDAAIATGSQARPVHASLTLHNAGEAALFLDSAALRAAVTTTPAIPVLAEVPAALTLTAGATARVRFTLGPMTAPPGLVTVQAQVRAQEINRDLELTAEATAHLQIVSPADVIVTRAACPPRATAASPYPWTVRFHLTNRGGSAAILSEAQLVARRGAANASFATSPLTGLAGGGWTLLGGATDSLDVVVTRTDSIAGIVTLQLAAHATEVPSERSFDLISGAPALLLLQNPPQLVAVDSTLAPRAASRGQQIALRLAIRNHGGATVHLDPARTAALLVGTEYRAPLAHAVAVPPGDAVWLDFAPASLGSEVEAGQQPIAFELAGDENGNPWNAALVLTTPLHVDPAAHLEVVSVRADVALATAGQSRAWNVQVEVRNPGAPVRFETAGLAFVLGTEDVSDEYDIALPSAFESGETLLPTGGTERLQFIVQRTGTRTGLVVLDASVRARDTNSQALLVSQSQGAARGSVRIVTSARPVLTAAEPSQVRVSAGQHAAWSVRVTMRNDGGTAWEPDWTTATLGIGTVAEDEVIAPSRFDTETALLEPGTSASATFLVQQTALELGSRALVAGLAGRQTTDATRVDAGAHAAAAVQAERPARIELTSWSAAWARTGFANFGQGVPLRFTLANTGDAASTATLRLQCTNATPAESVLAIALPGGATRSVSLDVRAGDRPGVFAARIEALDATDAHDSTQATAWEVHPHGEVHGTVESPGALRLAALASQARVSAGQTAPWWVDLEVENLGAEPLELAPPRSADLNFERDGVAQSDYLIEPPAELASGGLGLDGGARGVLRYRITQAGRQSGHIRLHAGLVASHRNDPTALAARAEAETHISVDGEPGLRIVATESITWRRTRGFDDFRVQVGQPFAVQVTVANTGGTPLDSIRVGLASQRGNSRIEGTGFLDVLAPSASAVVEFAITAGSWLSDAGLPETFVAHLIAARDRHSGRAVVPGAALDATTFATVETPSALALEAWIASPDGARGGILSPGQEFVVAARVVNEGQSSVNDAGRVRLGLPHGFTSATDPLERYFIPGATLTWTLHAAAATSVPESLTVALAALPQDQTSGAAAGATRSRTALGVEVHPLAAFTAEMALEDPDGARDGIVSTGQALHVSLVVRGDVDLVDRRARFQLPVGWRDDPNQPTKDALPAVPESRSGWDFAAGDAVGATRLVVRIEARDRRSGAAYVALDTLAVEVVPATRLAVAAEIVEPEASRGGRLIPGGAFTVRAIVRDQGAAGLATRPDGTHGRLRLVDLPATYALDGATREFTLDAHGTATVEWHAVAPAADAAGIAAPRIVLDGLPLDANTGLSVALDPDSSQARLALTLVDAALHVASEVPPAGARLAGETRVPLLTLVVRNDADRPVRLDSLGVQVRVDGVVVAAHHGLAGLHVTFDASPGMISQPVGADAWLELPGGDGAIWIAPGDALRCNVLGDLALTAAGAAVSVSARDAAGAPRLRARAGGAAIAARADARDALASDPLRIVAATQASYAAPNPFHVGRESTAIHYDIAAAGSVQVRVYTLQGGLVWETTQQESSTGPALRHVTWDGRNGAGAPVRNGVYVCRVTSGAQTETFKIAVLR